MIDWKMQTEGLYPTMVKIQYDPDKGFVALAISYEHQKRGLGPPRIDTQMVQLTKSELKELLDALEQARDAQDHDLFLKAQL